MLFRATYLYAFDPSLKNRGSNLRKDFMD